MSGVKGKGHKFIPQEFKMIKALLDNGVSKSATMKITGRSWHVVHMVSQTNSFDAYKELVSKTNREYEKSKEKSEPKSVTPDSSPKVDTTNDTKIIRTVQNVADAINRLVDILEQDTPVAKEAKEYKIFGRKR